MSIDNLRANCIICDLYAQWEERYKNRVSGFHELWPENRTLDVGVAIWRYDDPSLADIMAKHGVTPDHESAKLFNHIVHAHFIAPTCERVGDVGLNPSGAVVPFDGGE
jgi:hypothetical protein